MKGQRHRAVEAMDGVFQRFREVTASAEELLAEQFRIETGPASRGAYFSRLHPRQRRPKPKA